MSRPDYIVHTKHGSKHVSRTQFNRLTGRRPSRIPRHPAARRRKMALDARRRLYPCYHEWEFRADWVGDPGVIGGTCDYYWLECASCHACKPATAQDAPSYDDDYL